MKQKWILWIHLGSLYCLSNSSTYTGSVSAPRGEKKKKNCLVILFLYDAFIFKLLICKSSKMLIILNPNFVTITWVISL